MLVLAVHELVPRLLGVLAEDVVVVGVEGDVVLVDVSEELVGAEHLGDLDQLVIVVLTLEEGLLLEYHASEHAAEGPDVEGVIVGLQVDEQLGALEVAGGHAHVILLAGVVELSESPIDQSELAVGVVDHDVVGLDVAVGDALGVAVVERAQHLEDVVSNVEVGEALVQGPEVDVAGVNVLHDERGGLGHGVTDHIDEVDDVDAALEGLQDLDLASDLGLLHYTSAIDKAARTYLNVNLLRAFLSARERLTWLEYLNDDSLPVGCVDTLIDLGVLASADLLDDLVVLLRPTQHSIISYLPFLPGPPLLAAVISRLSGLRGQSWVGMV